jgi:hypothetical protein
MENHQIQCPKCGNAFAFSEALRAELREHMKEELGQEVARREAEMAKRVRALEARARELTRLVESLAEEFESTLHAPMDDAAGGARTATPWLGEVAAEAPSVPAGAKDASAEVRELIRGELATYLTTPFDALKRLVADGPETFESNRLEGGRKVNVRVTADRTRHGKAVRVTMDIQGGPWPLQERTAFFIMDESGRVVDQSRWLHA